ncbi:hypothetical protein DL93DRAFT_2163364 [Clavulina sp. PMI_390]|nr:hypothetical protein DL93DRAFT_2163364 [Clavulina sp. PMI_390]
MLLGLLLACAGRIIALPLPRPQDPSLPFVEVDLTPITTTLFDIISVAQSIPTVVDFIPLFAPPTVTAASTTTTTAPDGPIQIITVFATPSSSISATQSPATSATALSNPLPGTITSSVPVSTVSSFNPLSTWSLPRTFSNLDSFQVQKYAGGETNIKIVTGIPATATAPVAVPTTPTNSEASQPSATASGTTFVQWDNDTDVSMQLFYPKGSINPGNKPQGGADFYATPISLNTATNVTMEYSVFVDANMEFVKGGKLPGLYGGHEGCSGGDVADSCFSTRLMWRPQGAGELYFYADKSKQLPSLCQAPDAECNEVYGLSLGRGSFRFVPGQWTNLRQTVSLNTPGVPDGGFTLDVNGVRVMTLNGLYYRNTKSTASSTSTSSKPASASTSSITGNAGSPHPSPTSSLDIPPLPSGTDLPPLLGGLLHGLGGLLGSPTPSTASEPALSRRRTSANVYKSVAEEDIPQQKQNRPATAIELIPPRSFLIRSPLFERGPINLGVSGGISIAPANVNPPADAPVYPAVNLAVGPEPAFGFTGIFFSTFFGGHDPTWETPKDQYMWFKGFGLEINS